ncbi:Origin recognition complex subunit 4 [Pseudocercospora fuligena]|uniref:Origin recognition complex subunit 4 n=1 Tax=Pseudocercospora fuligena TaxID=685502 RepID=A0A8H6VN65_9PEZI|nr:Origin recognition complex subunit 4 [Pseudocercospora fuligena]
MSTSRAPKRRKLNGDDEHQSSPAQASKSRTPITYGKQSAKSSPVVKASTSNDAPAKSGAEIYFEAKMKTWKRKLGKDSIDVYDDIEGANHASPKFKQRPVSGSRNGASRTVSAAAASSPSKKNLDPLRNQRSTSAAVPVAKGRNGDSTFKPVSGRKSTYTAKEGRKATTRSRQSTAKGKAYEAQDAEEESDQAAESEDANQEEVDQNAEDEVGAGASEDEEDTVKVAIPAPTLGKKYAKMSKGWVAAAAKPKTFEDEIRELQEKARREVAEGSDDELVSDAVEHTPSKKTSSQRRSSARPRSTQLEKAAPTPTPTKPLDRRKRKPAQPADDFEVPESDVENRMEVDESDDDSDDDAVQVEPIKPIPQPRSKAATTPKKTRGALTATNVAKAAGPRFSPAQVRCIQKIVLEKATKKRPTTLVNLDDEYSKVSTLIEQTVTAGESNSMLLIGARGSGKTALVNQILREQAAKHATDFHAVRLNGFIHTDDKIALREIWRQLGREMELDEEESISKNYADTMTRLLALLSHPAEVGLETDQVTKSVIFVLDEFELFASHPRQTLLYNLFDIAQSRKAPIAVLGLTTRIDVAESLEKRVKSRFSHRYVHLSMAKSLSGFESICRSVMAISSDDLTADEKDVLDVSEEALKFQPVAAWNAVVDKALASEACSSVIRRLYYTTKSAPELFATLSLTVATMPTDSPTTKDLLEHFSNSLSTASLQAPDSKLTLLSSLSTLQLALLICAARLTNIYNTEVISFALAYEEYKVLASKARLQASASGAIATTKVWGKDVAKGAWDQLIDVGLIMEDGRTGGTGRVDVALEEIGMSGVDLGAWGRWCKEI